MAKTKLNIGMVGYGFMGRTHSNAFSQVGRFFDVPYQPVLWGTSKNCPDLCAAVS